MVPAILRLLLLRAILPPASVAVPTPAAIPIAPTALLALKSRLRNRHKRATVALLALQNVLNDLPRAPSRLFVSFAVFRRKLRSGDFRNYGRLNLLKLHIVLIAVAIIIGVHIVIADGLHLLHIVRLNFVLCFRFRLALFSNCLWRNAFAFGFYASLIGLLSVISSGFVSPGS